jgi:hypothetical protein
MPVAFPDFSTGCPRELLNVVERNDVRVVVQAEERCTTIFDHVRLRDTAALAQ